MKIALYNLTTTVLTGGIETFNWEVGRELRERGHIVHIYGGESGKSPQYALPVYTYPYRDRNRFPDFGSRFRKMAERWSMARNCLKDLQKRKYDIIIIHKPYDLPWILRVAGKSAGKVVFCSGGREFFPGYGRLVKKLDLFTACSNFNAGQIEDYCGVRPKVLYNGVDPDVFCPLAADISLQERILSSADCRVIFSAARLKRTKGFHYVIEAVSKLKAEFPGLYYLIAGEGSYREELVQCVRRFSLQDRVKFLGNVPHHLLSRYYSFVDVAVFPSLYLEAFGISIAEAMSCGVPVVGSNTGGIPEVIGDAGILCAPANSEQLAEGLRRILSNADVMRRMGENGRQRITSKFTWKQTVDTLENYLEAMG